MIAFLRRFSGRYIAAAVMLLASLKSAAAAPPDPAQYAISTATHAGTWRSFRTVWSFSVGANGDNHVTDVIVRGDRLLFGCESGVGCVNKNNGRLIWRCLIPPDQSSTPLSPQLRLEQDGWRVVAGEQQIYLCNKRSMHIHSVEIATGELKWGHVQSAQACSPPRVAGSTLLVPMSDRFVEAIDCASGKPIWSRSDYPRRAADSMVSDDFSVEATVGFAIVRTGGAGLVGLRTQDGAHLWDYPANTPTRGATTTGAGIADGAVYSFTEEGELTAIDSVTGTAMWTKNLSTPGYSVNEGVNRAGVIVTHLFRNMISVRKPGSRTAKWIELPTNMRPIDHADKVLPWHKKDSGIVSRVAIFGIQSARPMVNGYQCYLQTPMYLDTVVVCDSDMGAKSWRWQPTNTGRIEKITSDGDWLYVSDGDVLRAFEPGNAARQTAIPTGSDELANQTVLALFGHKRGVADPKLGYITGNLRNDESILTLLRLGSFSTKALMDFVRCEVAGQDERVLNSGRWDAGSSFSYSLSVALNIVSNIADRSCVPDLIHLLNDAKHSGSRLLLATTLIRLGDTRAASALFRYVRSNSGSPELRRDALYMVCRAPEPAMRQQLVTAYLEREIVAPDAPLWLRLFARFELLNNRGASARRTAIARFVRYNHSEKIGRKPGKCLYPLTDDEGIFQSVVEALCQVGASTPNTPEGRTLQPPLRFGAANTSLILQRPPGRNGIEIMGQPGYITFCRADLASSTISCTDLSPGEFQFVPPHIDVDGVYHDKQFGWSLADLLAEAFALVRPTADHVVKPVSSWRRYFPYQLSTDGRTARVGWEQMNTSPAHQSQVGYDIETKKIRGRWVPVQCRLVAVTGNTGEGIAVIPLVRTREPLAKRLHHAH